MARTPHPLPQHLPVVELAFSNFLASFGGGTILAKAMGVLAEEPALHGDALVAFLIGTSLGVFVLKGLSRARLEWTFRFFSLGAALLSIALFQVLSLFGDSVHGLRGGAAWVFFALLCARFMLWFMARVCRTDAVAGLQQKISWVELAYFCGIICGLAVWQRSGLHLPLSVALPIDALIQSLAGFVDLFSHLRLAENTAPAPSGIPPSFDWKHCRRLVAAVVTLVVGTQIVEFGFAQLTFDVGTGNRDTAADIVAVSYLGAALAALFCAFTRVRWERRGMPRGSGALMVQARGAYSISLLVVTVLAFGTLALAIVMGAVGQARWSFLLGLLAFSACLSEVVALALLDRIGEMARLVGKTGLVAQTYGLMGAFGTLLLIAFVQIMPSSYALLVALFVCLVGVNAFLLRTRPALEGEPAVEKY